MKQDNSTLTTREKAELWWNELPDFTKDELNIKYWFDTIETIYAAEHPEQSLPEETIKEEVICEHCGKDKKVITGLCPHCGKFPAIKEQSSNIEEGEILEGITQGEWEIQGLEIRNNKNEFVANCMCKYGNAKEDYANARLIANAPAMYRALKEVVYPCGTIAAVPAGTKISIQFDVETIIKFQKILNRINNQVK